MKTNKTNTTPLSNAEVRDLAQEAKLKEKAEKKARFLSELQKDDCAGNVKLACTRAGVSRIWMYECRKEDEEFAKAWTAAVAEGYETLKSLALSSLYTHLIDKDKTITMFTLRQLDPETWNKDRERTGEGGGPVIVEHKVSPRFAKVMERLLADKEDGKPKPDST